MAIAGGNRRRRRVNNASAADAHRHLPRLPSAVFSPLVMPAASSAPGAASTADSSIAQIKLTFTSRRDSLCKETDLMHASLMTEVSSASARLAKRLKMELQSSSQHMDEFEREGSAFLAGYKEEMDEIQGNHEEFVSKAQNFSSQYLKKILPEFMENVQKDMEKLHARFVSPP